MKKLFLQTFALLLFAAKAYAGGDDKLTLKEKVEQSKEVKVFYCVREITDENDERLLKASNPEAKTLIHTAMPAEYAGKDIKDSILNILNRILEVGKTFVEGDASSLPESKNRKTQYKDLSKLPDGFYVLMDVSGEYTRTIQKKVVDGNTLLEVLNSMEITSHLHFYEVVKSEIEPYGDMFMRSGVLLGNAKTPVIKSERLENLDYMEKTFPALSLLKEYKESMYRLTNNFAEKQLKKHNKAVSKRN